MWLPLGPVLEPLEDAVVALDDPVLIDGSLLHLGSRYGHAKAHFQDPAPWTHKRPGLGRLPREGDTETFATRTEGHNGQRHSGHEREQREPWPVASKGGLPSSFWDWPWGSGQKLDFEPGAGYMHRWCLSLDLVTFLSPSHLPQMSSQEKG